jgi:putative aminopeptidase FrvX
MGEVDEDTQELTKMDGMVGEEEAVQSVVEAAIQAAVMMQVETLVASTIELWRRRWIRWGRWQR